MTSIKLVDGTIVNIDSVDINGDSMVARKQLAKRLDFVSLLVTFSPNNIRAIEVYEDNAKIAELPDQILANCYITPDNIAVICTRTDEVKPKTPTEIKVAALEEKIATFESTTLSQASDIVTLLETDGELLFEVCNLQMALGISE